MENQYLDLMKRSLMGLLLEKQRVTPRRQMVARVNRLLGCAGVELVRIRPLDPQALEEGREFTDDALTMVGRARLLNIEECVRDVVERDVPGDLIETGAWRGGAAIFMRAVLAELGSARNVWVADTFEGLPAPSQPADADDRLHTMDFFAVSEERVRASFERYGLLDDQVRFVKGLFRDTLPGLDGPWAVIRLDGDLYESTMDALVSLYPNLSVGGWVIVDDYGALAKCAQAVDDFRREHAIDDPLRRVDWSGVCWRRGH